MTRSSILVLTSSLLLSFDHAVFAEEAAEGSPFAPEIQAFQESDAKNPPPKGAVLFVGSSTIRRWTSLTKDFPDLTVINRGFGGSEIADSVRYVDRIVIPYKPRHIVMYAGSNDITDGKSPEQLLSDFKQFVTKVHAALPKTTITFISINPSVSRWQFDPVCRAANKLIEAYCDKEDEVDYVDSYSKLLTKSGTPRAEILQPDKLHLNDTGYHLLTSVVRPALVEEVAREHRAQAN